MLEKSVGTQQQMGLYLNKLYKEGYDFRGSKTNYDAYMYTSPIDKRERHFGQHFLG